MTIIREDGLRSFPMTEGLSFWFLWRMGYAAEVVDSFRG